MSMRLSACKHLFLFGFLTALLFSPPVQASDLLTEETITDFIYKTSEMTNGMHNDMSAEEVSAYFEMHLHKDAYFKSKIQYNIPGYPPKINAMSLDREEFIEKTQSGAQALEGYKQDITVRTIKISSDGRKANVMTNGKEEGVMAMHAGGSEQKVPIIGHSTCNQIIMLNEAGIIQMFSANCNTEINFQEF